MAETVKVVVEIPKETYLEIRSGFIVRNAIESAEAIKNGTLLPKGHGRLIDERQINECKQVGLDIRDGVVTRCLVTDAPTIIEAEKQSLKQIRRNKDG